MQHYTQTKAFPYFQNGDPRLRTVTDEAEFWDMVRLLEKVPSFATDTETSGIAWHKHARICGIAFGTRLRPDLVQNWYVPFRHQTGEQQLPEEVVLRGAKILLENTNIGKILHHKKFDDHMFRKDGIHLGASPIRDTMVEAHLYDENAPLALKTRAAVDLGIKEAHLYEALLSRELKRLAKYHGMKITEYKDTFGYSQLPIHLAGTYACYDTDFTWLLAEFYDRCRVRQSYAGVYATEIALTRELCDMEEHGIPVDKGYLLNLKEAVTQAKADITPAIFSSLGGYKFNIGSDDELRHVLTNVLGLPLWKKTKKDKFSVDKEVLSHFAEDHPSCQLLLDWREADKIQTTYTDSILKRIGWDGMLHGQFRPQGTNTGRLSSSNPNMQNFASDSNTRALAFSGKGLEEGGQDPWSIKRAFLNRGPGWKRTHWDYSQIELRVLAQYSQDPTMLDVYAKGEDIHHRTQLEVFGDPAKHLRRLAKIINFGLSYCLSAAGFARQAKIAPRLAEQHMENFFARYPRISPYRDEFWAFCRNNNNSFLNMFGRPRRIPMLRSHNGSERGRAERQCIGSLIQGTAAELTKVSIVRIGQWNRQNGVGMKFVSTIHDEISMDFPNQVLSEASREVRRMMEDFPEFNSVPVVVDGEYSDTNWAEKKPLEISP